MLSISTPLGASNGFHQIPNSFVTPTNTQPTSVFKHSLTALAPSSSAAMCSHYNGNCGAYSIGQRHDTHGTHECCGQHACSTPASNQKSIFNPSKNI
jgi:hypothetical protein